MVERALCIMSLGHNEWIKETLMGTQCKIIVNTMQLHMHTWIIIMTSYDGKVGFRPCLPCFFLLVFEKSTTTTTAVKWTWSKTQISSQRFKVHKAKQIVVDAFEVQWQSFFQGEKIGWRLLNHLFSFFQKHPTLQSHTHASLSKSAIYRSNSIFVQKAFQAELYIFWKTFRSNDLSVKKGLLSTHMYVLNKSPTDLTLYLLKSLRHWILWCIMAFSNSCVFQHIKSKICIWDALILASFASYIYVQWQSKST